MGDYCPVCGVALVTGVSHCADCGEELIKPIQHDTLTAEVERLKLELAVSKGHIREINRVKESPTQLYDAIEDAHRWYISHGGVKIDTENDRLRGLVRELVSALASEPDIGVDAQEILTRARAELEAKPMCQTCGNMGRVPYGKGIADGDEYDLCPDCNEKPELKP